MHPDFERLLQEISAEQLLSAALSSPKIKSPETATKINIRPLIIKGQLHYQISEQHAQQVFHRNITPLECRELIARLFPSNFLQGVFETSSTSYHVLVNKRDELNVLKKRLNSPVVKTPLALTHNRTKNYLLPEGSPIPFLVHLGIMTAEGKVVAKKYNKFRQINRFIEMIDDIKEHLPKEQIIEIIDFGCGKAYLTFALYYYLHHLLNYHVHIVGLDLKREVITTCQTLADELGYKNLQFQVGDINHHTPQNKVDMVISLHACDTATDAALEKAVKWGAEVILCVPCCQHELFSQLHSPALDSLLRYGLLKERFAALATDAARAELLIAQGYEVQILEFIDMEHTPKNILIRAIKKVSIEAQKSAQERYARLKAALNITPNLEIRFKDKAEGD